MDMQRAVTAAYIATDPTEVIIRRPGKVSDGSGGFRINGESPLPPQTVRIISAGTGSTRRTVDGEEEQPDIVLLGEWDADIQVDDVFMFDGDDYQVQTVLADLGYETYAEVTLRD